MSDWKSQFREWGAPFVCICCCFVNINLWEQCWHYILNLESSSLSQGFEYTHCRWHREREKSQTCPAVRTQEVGEKLFFVVRSALHHSSFSSAKFFVLSRGKKVSCHHQWEYGAWVSFTNWIWRVRKKIEKSLR